MEDGGVRGHSYICSSGRLLWAPFVGDGLAVGDKQVVGSKVSQEPSFSE